MLIGDQNPEGVTELKCLINRTILQRSTSDKQILFIKSDPSIPQDYREENVLGMIEI